MLEDAAKRQLLGPVTRLKIRVIKHEIVPDCGSYEVRFPDGRPSVENLPGRICC
jgi:hypothetical protein